MYTHPQKLTTTYTGSRRAAMPPPKMKIFAKKENSCQDKDQCCRYKRVYIHTFYVIYICVRTYICIHVYTPTNTLIERNPPPRGGFSIYYVP